MPSALLQTRLPEAEWRDQLDRLTSGLDAAALNWISGFTAALALERGANAPAETVVAMAPQATVLYGSQTGHGRRVAEQLAQDAGRAGLAVRVQSALDYDLRQLAAEKFLFVVMSTHGDGDPPDDARALVEFLNGRRAPRLEQLAYSVLALGDSSYPKYCEAGRLVDERLAALGARRLSGRVDCDVDYEEAAVTWLSLSVAVASAEPGMAGGGPLAGNAAGNSARVRLLTPLTAVPSHATHEHPLEVEVLANQVITGRGSLRPVQDRKSVV